MKQVFAVIFLAQHAREDDLLGDRFRQGFPISAGQPFRLQHEKKISP